MCVASERKERRRLEGPTAPVTRQSVDEPTAGKFGRTHSDDRHNKVPVSRLLQLQCRKAEQLTHGVEHRTV